MKQNLHDLGFYMDGNVKVEFCRVCSAEGVELNFECPGKYMDKKVDKTMELK